MNYNRNIKVKCDNKEFTKLYDLFEYLYNVNHIDSIYELLDYPICLPTISECNIDSCDVITDDIKPFLKEDISDEIRAVIKPHLKEQIAWDSPALVKDLAEILDLDEKVLLKIAFKWLHEI